MISRTLIRLYIYLSLDISKKLLYVDDLVDSPPLRCASAIFFVYCA